jgi:hypothetical protein
MAAQPRQVQVLAAPFQGQEASGWATLSLQHMPAAAQRAGSRASMPLALLALTFAAHAIGTAEFIIVGLLPTVAEDLGIALDAWIGGEVVANSLGLVATPAWARAGDRGTGADAPEYDAGPPSSGWGSGRAGAFRGLKHKAGRGRHSPDLPLLSLDSAC